MQLELRAPGESRHFDDATGWHPGSPARPCCRPGDRGRTGRTRGWNARIVIETGRALAVVLAEHTPGDMIAWSALSPALRSRDLTSPAPPRSSARRDLTMTGSLLHLPEAGPARGPALADGRRRRALAAHPQRGRPRSLPATSTPSG